MPCTHKFHDHHLHLPGELALLPNWNVKTLIIGTFNPEHAWHPMNQAEYFYGRTRNHLWNVLPRFACEDPINHNDVETQINFLQRNQVGLTDLLIRINDADINNDEHVRRVRTVLDDQLELFNDFIWNTSNIINHIRLHSVEAVYFTKLGIANRVNVNQNTFEAQMRLIEQLAGVPTFRLHTPSGQGLGAGEPRVNNLINRWYNNGGDHFPFLCAEFDLNDFPYQQHSI